MEQECKMWQVLESLGKLEHYGNVVHCINQNFNEALRYFAMEFVVYKHFGSN